MTRATSALVPPISRVRALATPAWRARNDAPMTPDAVPDSSMLTQDVRPISALMMPPFDLVIIGGALTPRSARARSSDPR